MDDDGNTNIENNSQSLVKTLCELFRNQTPTDWNVRRGVYIAALQVCHSLTLDLQLAVLFGNFHDRYSLLTSLRVFAYHAKMIAKHEAEMNNEEEEVEGMTEVMFLAPILQVLHRDIKQTYRDTLTFDMVNTLSNHFFLKNTKYTCCSTPINTRKIFKEILSFTASLPVEYGSSIFVRAVSTRINFLRVLITGPDDTPYTNGCFLFYVYFTHEYPTVPPNIYFCTTGAGTVRFNLNLYKCGKVCLSLLGTCAGLGWIPNQSTLLQVLISIQSLVLVPDPYYNEPCFERSRGTPGGQQQSDNCNKKLHSATIHWGVLVHLKSLSEDRRGDYPEFADVMRRHFLSKQYLIQSQLKLWAKQNKSIVGL